MVKPYYAGLPVGAAQMTSHAIGADVTSLAFSPDGERLAVATTDGQVRVFRVHSNGDFSGSARYLGHRQAVNTVAWSPDGTCIASAGNDTAVHVWDAINGEVRYIYRGHAALVYALAFSPDGAWIASAGLASELLVWDAQTGMHRLSYRGHRGIVRAVAWSPDGRKLASGGEDRQVEVWDAASGKTLFSAWGHAQAVLCVAWSPDSRYIATGGQDHLALSGTWQLVNWWRPIAAIVERYLVLPGFPMECSWPLPVTIKRCNFGRLVMVCMCAH